MNETKKHIKLEVLENTIKDLLNTLTNAAYSQNYKHKYSISFIKGTEKLELNNKVIKDYYTLEVFYLDKTNIIEIKNSLFKSHYPVEINIHTNKLYEKGLTEFLQTSISALSYVNMIKTIEKNSVNNKEIDKPKSNLILSI